jgi:ankyrin repeat protein
MFLWNVAHLSEQYNLRVTENLFFQALENTGKMVIILDGFDEIAPYYAHKVRMLISTIKDKTASKLWISSRLSHRKKLEDIVGKFAFTLQPFTSENQIQFLKQYWSEVTEISNKGKLEIFAKQLLELCSQNFTNKDVQFTGIPLQTMMLGEAFVKEAKENCCVGKSNLPEKFDLLFLFKKFTDKKFDIYFREKNEMNPSKPEVKSNQKDYIEKHMISALLYLFSRNEVNGVIHSSKLEHTINFLQEYKAQMFGIITDTTDGKPHFIHRCFAEYLAAKWFTDNFVKCGEFISNVLFKPTYEIIRIMCDRMLAEGSEIHESVLKNDINAPDDLQNIKININHSDKGGRTALHLASSYNRQYIQQLLSFPDIDVKIKDDVLKWTPLKYADRTKSWMAMNVLLQKGADPDDIVFTRDNARDQEWGQAAVWECASKGHIQLLEFILNCGIEVNATIDVPENLHENFTILHRASYCGQVEVVRFIANRGADINVRDTNNNTALHIAAKSGSVDIINVLLDNGISVNLTDIDDFTPLHLSAQFGNLEGTRTLVERGADINKTNKRGATPLMRAAAKGKLEILLYLTEILADINIRDTNNNTGLHCAAESGSVGIIKLLLNKGMSVNLIGKDNFTPLHFTVHFGKLEATKTLVERSADINKSNKYGVTPLMTAAFCGKLEILRYLTEKGADTNIRDKFNQTAIYYAARSGRVDIINVLLDKGMSVNLTNTEDVTPLHVSARFGNLETTKTLVERGADTNKTNKHSATPLMSAAYSGKLETFRYLTEIGADINIRDDDKNTALHYAAKSGSVDIIKVLLDKGMSVNLTNTDDFTPLHVSAQFGNLEATKTLVERGADIKKIDRYGLTPLMMAADCCKLETFRYLTEIGADISICNNGKQTALHYAAKSGSVDIAG